MTPEDPADQIRSDLSRVRELVDGLVEEGFEDDVLFVARKELADLRAAADALLERADEIPQLQRAGDALWRTYATRRARTLAFLEPLS